MARLAVPSLSAVESRSELVIGSTCQDVGCMGRPATTCMLAAFLAADPRKPEEQATAVLASALASSEPLLRALLEWLGIAESGRMGWGVL